MAASRNNISSITEMTSKLRIKADGELCQICCSAPTKKLKMPVCEHLLCNICSVRYFTEKIKKGEYIKLVCPVCVPNITNNTVENDKYLTTLSVGLRTILPAATMKELETLLADRKEINHPHFIRCPNMDCNHGFIRETLNKKQCCKNCKHLFCADCLEVWRTQHSVRSCQSYSVWIKMNRMKNDHSILNTHIDKKIEELTKCPKCCLRYILIRFVVDLIENWSNLALRYARHAAKILQSQYKNGHMRRIYVANNKKMPSFSGGCLHTTCTKCGTEYCSFCLQIYTRNKSCCSKNYGLHAHHPRYCYYYLRDLDIVQLQKLLQTNAVAFEPRPQSSLDFRLDNPDAHLSPSDIKYVEYLCGVIKDSRLDPVAIMSLHDIKQDLERHRFANPERTRGPDELDELFLQKCRTLLQEKVPLVYPN